MHDSCCFHYLASLLCKDDCLRLDRLFTSVYIKQQVHFILHFLVIEFSDERNELTN